MANHPSEPSNGYLATLVETDTEMNSSELSHLTGSEGMSRDKLRSKQRRKRDRNSCSTGQKGVYEVRGREAKIERIFKLATDVMTPRVTKPGWMGTLSPEDKKIPKEVLTREELEEKHGMSYFDWNGVETYLLQNSLGNQVIGALVGRPRSDGWENVQEDAKAMLEWAAIRLAANKEGWRGEFSSITHGLSFGGGQKKPQFLCHCDSDEDEVLQVLMEHPSIQRVCKFASKCFLTYGEKNYHYVRTTVETIRNSWGKDKADELRYWQALEERVGVFPCRTFNLGPQTATKPHLDKKNLAQGWCSITALGDFDASMGGHLVLWDYKQVIRFPAGSTILIPSALFMHSNTPVQPDETRYSIVQFAAGGLFRWVDNNLMTNKAFLANSDKEDIRKWWQRQQTRWIRATDMFTRVEELKCC